MITTEIVKRIIGFRDKGLPVVSLYVRVPTDPSSRGDIDRITGVAGEERMVADAVQTSAAGGLAALGLQPRLWAGSVAAVGCADTALKKYVVAASLRFPLPPEPEQ
jgi:hypothetical protein